MHIKMAGIDFNTAAIVERERFSLKESEQQDALLQVKSRYPVDGIILLSTCNRTELWISGSADAEPGEIICDLFDADIKETKTLLVVREDDVAVRHLFELTCGLKSMIFGEEQILSQVKNAAALSRECSASSPVLETLFRIAVTTAKKAKSTVQLASVDRSASAAAVRLLAEEFGNLRGLPCLVIGSGEMGRLAASALVETGANVTMTLRQYKSGVSQIPVGCHAVDYDCRYERISSYRAIISATRSPHYTLRHEHFQAYGDRTIILDLALPRDIDPKIGALSGVTLYDIDALGSKLQITKNHEAVNAVQHIIASGIEEFTRWKSARDTHRVVSGGSSDGGFPRFPLFVDLAGKSVVVIGAGRIAKRRIHTLLGYGCRVKVVAKTADPGIVRLSEDGLISLSLRQYEPRDLAGAYLAVVATDIRTVNAAVAEDAAARGILCSVADRRDECTFFFPATVSFDGGTIGICGNGRDHRRTKEVARRVRALMEDGDI